MLERNRDHLEKAKRHLIKLADEKNIGILYSQIGGTIQRMRVSAFNHEFLIKCKLYAEKPFSITSTQGELTFDTIDDLIDNHLLHALEEAEKEYDNYVHTDIIVSNESQYMLTYHNERVSVIECVPGLLGNMFYTLNLKRKTTKVFQTLDDAIRNIDKELTEDLENKHVSW